MVHGRRRLYLIGCRILLHLDSPVQAWFSDCLIEFDSVPVPALIVPALIEKRPLVSVESTRARKKAFRVDNNINSGDMGQTYEHSKEVSDAIPRGRLSRSQISHADASSRMFRSALYMDLVPLVRYSHGCASGRRAVADDCW
jgi:hypothetical protein